MLYAWNYIPDMTVVVLQRGEIEQSHEDTKEGRCQETHLFHLHLLQSAFAFVMLSPSLLCLWISEKVNKVGYRAQGCDTHGVTNRIS